MTASLRPGAGIAYVTPTTLVLTRTEAPDRDLLAALTTATVWVEIRRLLAQLADVAVAHLTDSSLEVAANGDGRATAFDADGAGTVVTGSDAGWTTASFVDVRDVELDLTSLTSHPDLPEFVVGTGAAPASSVRRTCGTSFGGACPFDELFGPTQPRTVESAAVRAAGSHAAIVLVGSDGRRIVLDRPVLFGRNPDVVGDDEREARLVRVADPAVSRRHALVRLDGWAATVADLGSTNGTTLSLPGLASTRVIRGRPEALTAGATVDLGGVVSFVVEAAA